MGEKGKRKNWKKGRKKDTQKDNRLLPLFVNKIFFVLWFLIIIFVLHLSNNFPMKNIIKKALQEFAVQAVKDVIRESGVFPFIKESIKANLT